MRVLLLAFLSLSLALPVCSLSSDVVEGKDRPVTKIVKMLKDMQKKLQAEKESDEEVYESLSCWCKQGKKDSAASIEAAQARIAELQTAMKEYNATVQSLESEMKGLKSQVQAAEKAMDEARVIRMKDHESFRKANQEYDANINAVDNAAKMVSRGSSFVQLPHSPTPRQVADAVSAAFSRRADMLDNSLSFSDRDVIHAFINDPEKFIAIKAAFIQESSGAEPETTFRLMSEDFKEDQKTIQAQEANASSSFEELIAAKKEEVKAAEEAIEAKRTEKANKKDALFKAEVEIKDKTKAIAADVEFAALAKEKCGTADEDYAARTKSRAEEIEGVGKAIEILDGDEAHATFSRTYSLLQQSAEDTRRTRVAQSLSMAAEKHIDARLVSLALKAKLDSFTKVKAAIDNMTLALKQEAQDDVKQKQFCTDSFNAIVGKVAAQKDAKSGFENKVTQLSEKLNSIAGEASRIKGEIAARQKEMKLAEETRAKEKADFKNTLADQQATQVLLKQAVETLRKVYQAAPTASALVEVSLHESAPDKKSIPKGLDPYSKNKDSFSILNLMQQLIADTKALEAEVTRDEKKAEDEYQRQIEVSNADIKTLQEGLATQAGYEAQTKTELLQTKESLTGSLKQLADLAAEESDLHKSCDFLLKNFDVRKKAREDELQSLANVKSILSGAKFLQK